MCLQAKDLLEEGQTLHRPLLRKLMEHVSEFVHCCNIAKYNPYLLHIFTFVARCVGINQAELKQMSSIFNLVTVMYVSEERHRSTWELQLQSNPAVV